MIYFNFGNTYDLVFHVFTNILCRLEVVDRYNSNEIIIQGM